MAVRSNKVEDLGSQDGEDIDVVRRTVTRFLILMRWITTEGSLPREVEMTTTSQRRIATRSHEHQL